MTCARIGDHSTVAVCPVWGLNPNKLASCRHNLVSLIETEFGWNVVVSLRRCQESPSQPINLYNMPSMSVSPSQQSARRNRGAHFSA